MVCERCGDALVHAGSIPEVAVCTRCGKQRVGHGAHTVPQCPHCFGDLHVVVGRLPITLACARCPPGRSLLRPDFSRNLLHPIAALPPLQAPVCPQCGLGLTVYEDLPPRASCPRCDIDLCLEPIRPAPPCPLCGDQVRIVGEGAMPPQGECIGCGEIEPLTDAPEPYAKPIEITVQLMRHAPALPRRPGPPWLLPAVAIAVAIGVLVAIATALL